MPKQDDIHHYEKSYEKAKKHFLSFDDISERNKELVLEFERKCSIIENLAIPTKLKYFDVLGNIVTKYGVKKDFDKLKREDFEELIYRIEANKEITINTKQKYKAIIKKFGKWLKYKDKAFSTKTYPKIIEFINTNIKKKDQHTIKASDILTEEEVDKLLEVANTPMQKCFVSLIYELGSRIGEIGNLDIQKLTKNEYGYLIDLHGKTGTRTCQVVKAEPYITIWLNQHPNPKPESPLWVYTSNWNFKKLGKETKIGGKMDYACLRKMMQRLTKKAGIIKRVHLHLWRHTRISHILKNGYMNEAQCKAYFGLCQDSKQLSCYSHVVSQDANRAVVKANGLIENGNEHKDALESRPCMSCGKLNPTKVEICYSCKKPVDYSVLNKFNSKNELINQFLNVIMSDEEVFEVVKAKTVGNNKALEVLNKLKTT